MLFSSSIGDNIRYGRVEATDAEVEAPPAPRTPTTSSSRFPRGYATLVGERGVQLSGGQKQRVAIARAVLEDPRILILDEATSALDAESEHLVQEALDRLIEGRTTLVIAHRLSTVKNADRVLVLDGGRIVQQGTHAALVLRSGALSQAGRTAVRRRLTLLFRHERFVDLESERQRLSAVDEKEQRSVDVTSPTSWSFAETTGIASIFFSVITLTISSIGVVIPHTNGAGVIAVATTSCG